MAPKTQVNALAVGAVGAGLVFVWAGIRGSSVLSAVQDVVKGDRPKGTKVHGIDTQTPAAPAPAAGVTGPGKPYCASVFGGPGDPGTGSTGYRGDNLTGKMAYAELGMGKALGGLPYRQKARISYKGRSVIAQKLDIGAGGGPCGGHTRAVDLWYETARSLGFDGLGVVTFEPLP